MAACIDSVNFNPTRVRLKPVTPSDFDETSELQPHEGTSETGRDEPHLTANHFNPTRVRLKLELDVVAVDLDLTSTPRGYV